MRHDHSRYALIRALALSALLGFAGFASAQKPQADDDDQTESPASESANAEQAAPANSEELSDVARAAYDPEDAKPKENWFGCKPESENEGGDGKVGDEICDPDAVDEPKQSPDTKTTTQTQ